MLSKVLHIGTAQGHHLAHVLPGCLVAALVHLGVVKVFVGKGVEILSAQDFPDIGLIVQKADLPLLETVAFFPVPVACVTAVRAVIVKLQVIGRIAVGGQQNLSLLAQICNTPFKPFSRPVISCQKLSRTLDGRGGDLLIDLFYGRNFFINLFPALIQLPLLSKLCLVINTHDGIVLGIAQCHGFLLYSVNRSLRCPCCRVFLFVRESPGRPGILPAPGLLSDALRLPGAV